MIYCGSDSQIPPIRVTDRRFVIGGSRSYLLTTISTNHANNIIPIYDPEWEWSNQNSTISNVVLTIDFYE